MHIIGGSIFPKFEADKRAIAIEIGPSNGRQIMSSFNSVMKLRKVIRQNSGLIGLGFAVLALGVVFTGFLGRASKVHPEVRSVQSTGMIIERTKRYSGMGLNGLSEDAPQADEFFLGTGETFDVEGTALNPALYRKTTRDEARLINASLPFSPIKNARMPPFHTSFFSEVDRDRALHCMTLAVYFEAASESIAGQRAVAQVVLNRVRHPAWPHTVCGVVFQGSERKTGCQFSFTCDGALRRKIAKRPWQIARGVAFLALNGSVMHEVSVSTHYHTDWVAPYWSPSLRKLTSIGTHIFYTWNGVSGTPRAFRDSYKGVEDWPKLAGLTAPDLNPSKLDRLEKTYTQGSFEESAGGLDKIEAEYKRNNLQGREMVTASHSQNAEAAPRINGASQRIGIGVARSAVQSSGTDDEAKAPSADKL